MEKKIPNEINILKNEGVSTKGISSLQQKRKEIAMKEKGFRIFPNGKAEIDYMRELEIKTMIKNELLPVSLKNLRMSGNDKKIKNREKIEENMKNIENQKNQEKIINERIQVLLLKKEEIHKNKLLGIQIKMSKNFEKEGENSILQKKIEEKNEEIRKKNENLEKFEKELIQLQEKFEKIKKEPEKEIEKASCIICLEQPPTHACLPCGHKTYCDECVKKVGFKCFVCKQICLRTVKILE